MILRFAYSIASFVFSDFLQVTSHIIMILVSGFKDVLMG
jgi:hypothetical protein